MQTGPVVLSYGFRPFFLGAGLWAVVAMAIWLMLVTDRLDFSSGYGLSNWHAHELLFGFAPAAVVGFLMTTIPNWTGRFPLSGAPLAGLVALWVAGRLSMLGIDLLPTAISLSLDGLFLPVFSFFCARELLSAKRARDLKPVAALMGLSLLNGGFHVSALAGWDITPWARACLSIYLLLIMAIGGKLVPSFTTNWLARHAQRRLPKTGHGLDRAILLVSAAAFAAWSISWQAPVIALTAGCSAMLHLIRLAHWRSHAVLRAPMILAMHVAYAFIPIGLLAIVAASFGFATDNMALHLLAIGVMAGMILAIMNRSIRLHTGGSTVETLASLLSSPCIVLAAIMRAAAEMAPAHYAALIVTANLVWIAGFACFLIDSGPLLLRVHRQPAHHSSPPPTRISMR